MIFFLYNFDDGQGLAQTKPLVNQSTSYWLTRVINTPVH